MKKIMLFICINVFAVSTISAQIKTTPVLTNPIPKQTYNGPWVEIYAQKQYRGTKKIFTANTATVDLGYTPDTISVKVKPGYIAYLSVNCQEFSNEVAFAQNATQFIVSQKQICGIRIEKAMDFWAKFNGILSEIHNNDCKKFYGTIKFKVFETNESNERTYYTVNTVTGDALQKVVYNVAKTDRVERALFNINDYYIADRDYISGVVWDARRYKPYITTGGSLFPINNFKISETAYRNKKTFIEITTRIGSYHKGCDLCTDFTQNAEMPIEETKVYNLNATAWETVKFKDKTIQVGPFRKAPSGPVTFTGGGGIHESNGGPYHTTYLQFLLKD